MARSLLDFARSFASTARRRRLPEARGFVLALAALLAFACAAFVYVSYQRSDALYNQYDDSYITFRYAMNLARGRGLVFNVGEATDSASSLLYALLMAACYALGLHDLERTSTAIGLLSLFACVLSVFLACFQRTERLSVAGVLALATGLHGFVSGWAVSGMETVFYAALVAASAYCLFFRDEKLGWTTTALVCLAALTRVEGIFLVLAWGALAGAAFFRGDRPERLRLAMLAAGVGVTVAGFCAFKWFSYGTILPHAFLLKKVASVYQPNPHELWQTWTASSWALLSLAAIGLVYLPRTLRGAVFAGYLACSVGSLASGPWAEQARYSVHLLPLLAMLASVPLAVLCRRWPLLAFVGAGLVLLQVRASFATALDFTLSFRGHQACRKEVGRFIQQELQPKTPIISSDIGALAYAASDVPFFDLVGLTSARVALSRAKGENADAVLLASGAHLIADTCRGACASLSDYAGAGWLQNQSYWVTVLPPSDAAKHFGKSRPLFRCTSPDRLHFAVSDLGRR